MTALKKLNEPEQDPLYLDYCKANNEKQEKLLQQLKALRETNDVYDLIEIRDNGVLKDVKDMATIKLIKHPDLVTKELRSIYNLDRYPHLYRENLEKAILSRYQYKRETFVKITIKSQYGYLAIKAFHRIVAEDDNLNVTVLEKISNKSQTLKVVQKAQEQIFIKKWYKRWYWLK